jgi:hypothetical protein
MQSLKHVNVQKIMMTKKITEQEIRTMMARVSPIPVTAANTINAEAAAELVSSGKG